MRWQCCAAAVLLGWALSAVQPAAGQEQVDEVDGVCDESVRNGCAAGIPNDAAFPNFPPVYVWRCDGLARDWARLMPAATNFHGTPTRGGPVP